MSTLKQLAEYVGERKNEEIKPLVKSSSGYNISADKSLVTALSRDWML